jgi:predicted alpha/beta-fold hydrolase
VDINLSIKKQQEALEKIRKETIQLNRQKQDLFSQCQTAVSFIGLITKQIHHFNGLIDYYYNTAAKKIRASSPISSPLLVNLIYVNLDNRHKDDKAEDGKK